jgi:hypothetical protein
VVAGSIRGPHPGARPESDHGDRCLSLRGGRKVAACDTALFKLGQQLTGPTTQAFRVCESTTAGNQVSWDLASAQASPTRHSAMRDDITASMRLMPSHCVKVANMEAGISPLTTNCYGSNGYLPGMYFVPTDPRVPSQ